MTPGYRFLSIICLSLALKETGYVGLKQEVVTYILPVIYDQDQNGINKLMHLSRDEDELQSNQDQQFIANILSFEVL